MIKLFYKIGAVIFLIFIIKLSVPENLFNNKASEKAGKNPEIRMEVFRSEKGAWGYNIYLKNKLYIHQEHVPGINGNVGFRTKEDAEKTAALVMEKIKNKIIHPTVSMKELDSLKVLPNKKH
ncbi:MAG: DUF4907 domain-containing protein [Bacteroidota bacterium]|nr:DUF4907 domain-containing protein [Bacteroidota bacterium]